MTAKNTTTTVDWDPANDAVCAVILEAVADAKDIDPLEIGTPLYDVVDPDALDRLFATTATNANRSGGRLTFSYEGCEITVDSEGTITARPTVSVPESRVDAAPVIGAGASQK